MILFQNPVDYGIKKSYIAVPAQQAGIVDYDERVWEYGTADCSIIHKTCLSPESRTPPVPDVWAAEQYARSFRKRTHPLAA